MNTRCDCGDTPAIKITLTTNDGIVLDQESFCAACMEAPSIDKALSMLGLQIGKLGSK